jgi:CRP/FNR family transcriptional regulator, cyclic AMP receptor protein
VLRRDAKVELLKGVPLLSGCSKAELREIATIADEVDLREGTTLMAEGRSAHEFVVLVDGTVRVTQKGKTLADLAGGDWVGEIALLADSPRTATVTATSPVHALVITDRAFRQLMRKMPSIAVKVLESVSQRLVRDAKS